MKCTPKLTCGSSVHTLTLIRKWPLKYNLFSLLSIVKCNLKRHTVLFITLSLAFCMSVFIKPWVFYNMQLWTLALELDLVFCAMETDRDEFVSAELQPQFVTWRYISTGVPATILAPLLNFLNSWLFHLRQTESPFHLKPSVVLFSVGLAFGRVLHR